MTYSFALFIKPVFLPVVLEGSRCCGKIHSDCPTVSIIGDTVGATGYHGGSANPNECSPWPSQRPQISATPMCRCNALARTYPRGLFIEPHEHVWGQLLYAMSGVMWVETPHEALVVPPQRAVWLPPGVPHGIRVVSDLQMRNIYLRPALAATLDR
jgi:hypothetical protein